MLKSTVRLFLMVRVRYVGTVRFKNRPEVRYASTERSTSEVRSTQILNVPYRTAILGEKANRLLNLSLTTDQQEQKKLEGVCEYY